MTPEEKARAYDEVIKKLRRLHDNYDNVSTLIDIKKELEYIVPELKESEDERMFKQLRDFFKEHMNSVYEEIDDNNDMLAWLEKKCEKETKGNEMEIPFFKQKPADKVIEEEKPLLEKFKQAVYDCAWGKVTCKKEGETKEEYANRWAEHFLLMVRDWADDYIDFTIQQKLRNSYEKGKTDIIEKQGEQPTNEEMKKLLRTEYEKGRADAIAEMPKQEWSEDDEKMLNDTFDILSGYYSSTDDVVLCDNINKTETWLETIKDKVHPKQEWSENDEKNRIDTIKYLELFDAQGIHGNVVEPCINWLKSLPQNNITVKRVS